MFTHFPAQGDLAEHMGPALCLSVHRADPFLPCFAQVLFCLQQEPLLNILTSFSGYCSQDVTARSVYRIGDRKGCTAELRSVWLSRGREQPESVFLCQFSSGPLE